MQLCRYARVCIGVYAYVVCSHAQICPTPGAAAKGIVRVDLIQMHPKVPVQTIMETDGLRLAFGGCMHIRMYACMRVCMYACMHACLHACTHARMHARMYVCMHVCMYVCMYVFVAHP